MDLRARDQFGDLTPSASECLDAFLSSRNELKKPARDGLAGMRRVASGQHREIVAGIEIRHALECLWRRDAGFGQAVIRRSVARNRGVWIIGIREQPVFQQPTNPARIIVAGLSVGPTIERLMNDRDISLGKCLQTVWRIASRTAAPCGRVRLAETHRHRAGRRA